MYIGEIIQVICFKYIVMEILDKIRQLVDNFTKNNPKYQESKQDNDIDKIFRNLSVLPF